MGRAGGVPDGPAGRVDRPRAARLGHLASHTRAADPRSRRRRRRSGAHVWRRDRPAPSSATGDRRRDARDAGRRRTDVGCRPRRCPTSVVARRAGDRDERPVLRRRTTLRRGRIRTTARSTCCASTHRWLGASGCRRADGPVQARHLPHPSPVAAIRQRDRPATSIGRWSCGSTVSAVARRGG